MQELSQERVYELPSPMQPQMTLMCAWQTSGMPIFNHQHPRSTISSVDQILEWKMLARWQLCIEQSMVEKRAEGILETTLDHACISSILLHVLLILMFG